MINLHTDFSGPAIFTVLMDLPSTLFDYLPSIINTFQDNVAPRTPHPYATSRILHPSTTIRREARKV